MREEDLAIEYRSSAFKPVYGDNLRVGLGLWDWDGLWGWRPFMSGGEHGQFSEAFPEARNAISPDEVKIILL